MKNSEIAIARYPDHSGAEAAIKTLAQSGFDMTQISVVGRGYHTDENVIGFYNANERITFWGKYGAFWGGLWGLFSGGIFLTLPVIGPVIALGVVANVIVSMIEGAVMGGAGSALAAGLYSIGIPKDSVLEYETTLKANGFIVFFHGSSSEVAQARSILAHTSPKHLDVHGGVGQTAGALNPVAAAV